MRQRPESAIQKAVQVLDGTPPEMLKEQQPSTSDGVHLGDARRPDKKKEASIPARKFYRVTKGGRVLDPLSGVRVEIKVGKELDNVNYKIPQLLAQGVQLEEITDEQRTIGGFSL